MDLLIYIRNLLITIVLLLIIIPLSEEKILRKRNQQHYPPISEPTFLRDSVEKLPQTSYLLASYKDVMAEASQFVRSSIEIVPDITSSSVRLPLRDSVEKRPPPDEPVEPNDFYEYLPSKHLETYQIPYSSWQHFKNIAGVRVAWTPFKYQKIIQRPATFKIQPAPSRSSKETNEDKKIVCYIQGAAAYRKEPLAFKPNDMNPFACTHIIYAFATIEPHNYRIDSNDDEYDIIQGGFRSITGLKALNPKLKILISVGNGREDSKRFSIMVSSLTRRRDFIKSVVNFIEQYNFDGMDLHWHYPGDEDLGGDLEDREHLNSLLKELRDTFKPKGWLLSVAVPASRFRIEDGFKPKILGDLVDFVNLQAYNFHNDREPMADHHSNLYSRSNDHGLNLFLNVDYAVKYWIKKGFPRSKLILGIPFFGTSFTLQYYNQTSIGAQIRGPGKEGYYTQKPGVLGYFEICDLLDQKWKKYYDESDSPYTVSGNQWIGYDNVESIKRKVIYAKGKNLGGIMAFAADLDDFKGFCGEKWPLLRAINRYLKSKELSTTPSNQPYLNCKDDGLYNDPNNCANYYICKDRLSYHLSCDKNMLFDPIKGHCGFSSTENCRPGKTILVTTESKHIDNVINGQMKENQFKVVCYMTNWAFYRKGEGKFVPEHIDQRLCTHLIYAFASLDPEKLLMKEFDPWTDLDNNLYERVTSLNDIKVLISLGGWTDSSGDKYSKLVSDGAARRRFVVGAVSFLRKHNFDGLHFDWNYPVCWQSNCLKGPASDKPNFSKLIQELKKEFDKEHPRLLLSASISGYKEVIDVAYNLQSLGKSLDFMSVMTYDYHGSWEKQTGHVSPLYRKNMEKYPQYNTNFTMEYLVSLGAPRDKLIMGIPFYGQSFTLLKSDNNSLGSPSIGPGQAGDYTKQPGMLAYYEICHRIRTRQWIVKKNGGTYAYHNDQWVSYEDVDSIKIKADYIKAKGYGGAVAWTIDLDDFSNICCGGSFPLLRSLNRNLGLISENPPQEDCTKPPEPVTPVPPITTTGVDSGASFITTEHIHEHGHLTTQKPSTWWSPTSTTYSTWWSTKPSTTTSTTTSITSSSSVSTVSTTSSWWTTSRVTTKKPTTVTEKVTTIQMTTIPPPAVVMPDIDVPMKSCETGQYLSDPNNCNAYYRCILGELKKQYCAGGLHWNKYRNICDWPNEANCDKKTTSMTWWPTTTPSSTTPFTSLLIDRKCNNGQYYPHESCSNYYVCVNGILLSQNCAPGLHWNQEYSMCDWKYKAKCIENKENGQKFTQQLLNEDNSPKPYSKCEENSFASYSADCSQYLHCLWGRYEIFHCAPGLHWNNEQNICDWPEEAKCSHSGTSDESDNFINKPITTAIPEVITTTKPTKVTTTPTRVTSTTWKPSSTTAPSWEWHPPIPPTSEKPPLSQTLKPFSGYYKIVCYFTNWAWYRKGIGKFLPEDIDPDLCTHIVYGFAVLDYENLIIKAHDSWADYDNRFYQRVTSYKNKGVKVSLALGGWNDSQGDKYSRLVNNPSARSRFISHVLEFLKKYEFDGLDLDWEYPKCWQVDCKKGPDSDKQAFAAFVKELRAAFKPRGLLLSSAVSPSKTVIDAGYDVPTLAENFDWIAVMTYDFHGQWDKKTGHVAPLFYHPDDDVAFFNANYSINYWINKGTPRRKIVMGIPLYGQSFQLANANNNGLNANAPGPGQAGQYTRAAGFLAYYEICDNIKNQGWTVVKDPKRRIGPYAYKGNQWVSFDDQEMIRIKSEYIRKMNLGGGMIWALDLDDFKNHCGEGRQPLLVTIRNTLAESKTPQIETNIPFEENFEEIPPSTTTTIKAPTFIPTRPSVDYFTMVSISSQTDVSTSLINRNSEFKVVCYFTNWAWYRQGKGKYIPSDIDPNLCTHIVYGFAVLNGDQLIIKPHDSWADFDNKFYEKVTAYKSKGIKVLIAIGGWNDSAGDKYSRLVNNPSARRRFISHVLKFISDNNFDGLDLDWEYPKCWQVDCNKGPESDKSAFGAFVKELHDAFKPRGLLLSSAVSPSKRVIDAGYDVPVLSEYLDWIAVMCYDYHGQWDKITGHVAPMYGHPEDVDATFNTNFTINYWIKKGADRKKLVMGMPMYGQSFSLADNNKNGLNAPTYGGGEAGEETRARGFLSYYEICSNIIQKGWQIVRDRKGRIGPYAYKGDQWVSFDDIGMIRHKSEYIKAMGLGGGMIWALDLDDFKNTCGCEEYPLLRTINRVLRDYAKPDPKCILGRPTKPIPPNKESFTTKKPPKQPVIPLQHLPCNGHVFLENKNNCNQYYLCNQGVLQLQTCPDGLYWNRDHCDWPENTECHPDYSTISPPSEITESPYFSITNEITTRPSRPTTYPSTTTGDYKVICYFTNWAWYRPGVGKYLPENIDPSLCTHINYGFAVLDPNSLTIKPHDSWADIDNKFYEKVVAYKSKGIKILIALGGWNDSLGNKYSLLVNSPLARAKFIRHVVEFIEKWGFDGLDLDWEYPKCWQVDCTKGPDSDKENFANLVRELSSVFKPKGLLLSAAVSPSKTVIDAGYDVPVLSQYFDWIAVMTYDFHGNWDKQTGHVAPLYYYPGDKYDYFNANFSINYWIEKGATPSKLIMGIPLYGQSFSLADTNEKGLNARSYGPGEAGEFTRAGGFLAFYEICEKVKRQGWQVTRDSKGRIGPYAVNYNQWVSYDDIEDIKRKSKLIRDLRLGGGMIWALDLDDFSNRCGCGKHPLLKTLNNQLRGIPSDIIINNCT